FRAPPGLQHARALEEPTGGHNCVSSVLLSQEVLCPDRDHRGGNRDGLAPPPHAMGGLLHRANRRAYSRSRPTRQVGKPAGTVAIDAPTSIGSSGGPSGPATGGPSVRQKSATWGQFRDGREFLQEFP